MVKICAVLLLGCLGPWNGSAQNLPGWALVWSDEFDQADGSAPDPAKWGYDVGGNGWGNNELEYYTARTNNARIEGGNLVIEARQESYAGKNYTSARLLTKGKWSWTHGRIESRIRIPRGQGLWPAFWMLGNDIDSVGWPQCGEIDIMENIGSEPGTVHGTVHGPGYSGANGIGGPFTLPGGAAMADDYHVFAVEWATNRIAWLVDDRPYFAVTPASLPRGTAWVFEQPQFLLLNLAVGGNWPGSPDATTTFPRRMTVDYVRVYAATNALGCAGEVLANPGFEAGGLTGWTTYGDTINNTQLGGSPALPVHGGSNVFKVYGQFSGAGNIAGVFTDVITVPGATYMASGWALTTANDRIAGGNTAWVEVSFRDAATNILSLYRSTTIGSATTPGTWLELAVSNQFNPVTQTLIGRLTNLVAPAGSALVRYQLTFRQPLTAAGSVLFDDLSLYYLGDPPIGVAVSAGNVGNNLQLTFPTLRESNYQLQFKNDLVDLVWQIQTNLPGTGGARTVLRPLGAERQFFRVVQVCE